MALIVRAGGRIRTSEACEILRDEFNIPFIAGHSGNEKWNSNVRAARDTLAKQGKIKRKSPHGRGVWEHADLPGDTAPPMNWEAFDGELSRHVEEARQMTPSQLQERAKKCGSRASKVKMVTTAFRRNRYVIAAVLNRAEGKCEDCGKDAPFLRLPDRSPYLEVHHKVRLADNGEDSIENAVALCPNCHRKAHFG
jgi:HNH endonuclease